MTKKTKKVEVEKPQAKEVVVESTSVAEQPKPKKVESKKPTWEIKDRVYVLSKSKNTFCR